MAVVRKDKEEKEHRCPKCGGMHSASAGCGGKGKKRK